MLETAVSVVNPCEVPLGTLLQFVSAIPREFTDHNGERETFYIRRLMQLHYLTSFAFFHVRFIAEIDARMAPGVQQKHFRQFMY